MKMLSCSAIKRVTFFTWNVLAHLSAVNRGGHSNRRGGSRAGRGGRGRGGRSYHHNDSSQQGNTLEIHWNDFACSLGNSFFLFVNPQIMFLHYCQVCYPTDLTWACVFASLFTSLTRQLRNVQTIPDWIIPNNHVSIATSRQSQSPTVKHPAIPTATVWTTCNNPGIE